MSKLQYKTTPPRKGFVQYKSDSLHERKNIKDKLPTEAVQLEALNLVHSTLDPLISKLGEMGYDMTQARFSIHYKMD